MSRKRKLPDWMYHDHDVPKEGSVMIHHPSSIENARRALNLLEEETIQRFYESRESYLCPVDDVYYDEDTDCMMTWGGECIEDDLAFDFEQSSVMDEMTREEALAIIAEVKGQAYVDDFPFFDDRRLLMADLRSCLTVVLRK